MASDLLNQFLRRTALTVWFLGMAVALSACSSAAPVTPPATTPAASPTPQASVATQPTVPMLTAVPVTPVAQPPATAIVTPSRPATTPTAELTPSVGAPATVPPTATRTAILPSPTPVPVAVRLESLRLQLKPVAEGLTGPLFVTHAGDGSGRLFIVEKPGTIRIRTGGRLLPRSFLDIRDRVRSSGSEQGLLGLAFAPDYPRSGYFFVNYTDQGGNTVVSRFRVSADPDLADPASEFQVLAIQQPAANHNGGMLAFGPDGYLYIGTGDGGGANDRYGNGQNPNSLLGKMLRIDVTSEPGRPYVIPPDNPWVRADWNGRDVRDEVWAVGLRNPWRYSFDRQTGDLWIADVGQNRYEEVHLVLAQGGKLPSRGLNFGWPIMEGLHCFPETASCQTAGLEQPVAEYDHSEGNCSITGGYVYRGAQNPALTGIYLYGDFCSGNIWGLGRVEDGRWRSYRLTDTDLSISSFGEDEAGELYLTDLRGGRVYQVAVP